MSEYKTLYNGGQGVITKDGFEISLGECTRQLNTLKSKNKALVQQRDVYRNNCKDCFNENQFLEKKWLDAHAENEALTKRGGELESALRGVRELYMNCGAVDIIKIDELLNKTKEG